MLAKYSRIIPIKCVRCRFAKARLEWQCQSEKERVEVERRHTEAMKQLHTELAELRTQSLTYKDKVSLLEATNAEQIKQLQNLEKELNVAQRDLNSLKKQNSKLDADYHEKDKSVNSLRTKVAVLEQELKDKGILISKHTEMLKTVKEQKQQLEDLLAEKEGQLQRKQNSLRNLSDELVKANEILTKLQNELASTKSKLKLRTSIALEQERLLDTKQKEVGQLENKMESLIKEAKDVKAEVENLREQLKIQQTQLEEKEKTIKNNDNGKFFYIYHCGLSYLSVTDGKVINFYCMISNTLLQMISSLISISICKLSLSREDVGSLSCITEINLLSAYSN